MDDDFSAPNPLAAAPSQGAGPQLGPVAANAPPADFASKNPILAELAQAHESARAQFGQVAEAVGRIDAVRGELRRLQGLGPAVSMDEIVKSAGRLAGAGIPANALATMLADMPQSPAGMQGWLAERSQSAQATEAQLLQQLAALRHGLGVSALRVLAGHHAMDGFMASVRPKGNA